MRRKIQHYKCMNCGKQFQSERRKEKLEQKIWKEHIWKRQTVADLEEKYVKGEHTIRRILDRAKVQPRTEVEPEPVVAVFDGTHIGDEILLVGRSSKLKRNLAFAWIQQETKEAYSGLRTYIESKGFTLVAVVLDGRTGIPKVFKDIHVQICQFHQLQIVRRKLTLHPETYAGQELLSLVFTIADTDEKTFTEGLEKWFKEYGDFMNEKTYILGTRRWRYTHRRLRSAYLSMKRNLPFLFTCQKFPELEIPNTTNSLDGYWSRVKNLLAAHRGKNKERLKKMINEILWK